MQGSATPSAMGGNGSSTINRETATQIGEKAHAGLDRIAKSAHSTIDRVADAAGSAAERFAEGRQRVLLDEPLPAEAAPAQPPLAQVAPYLLGGAVELGCRVRNCQQPGNVDGCHLATLAYKRTYSCDQRSTRQHMAQDRAP